MSNGSRIYKGANENWTSGYYIQGEPYVGFTMSVQDLGHSWDFNSGNGGTVTWRNVRITVRGGGRSDFNIGDDAATDYDIDYLVYDHSVALSLCNSEWNFDVGTIINLHLIGAILSVGGSGNLNNVTHYGFDATDLRIYPRQLQLK